MPRSSVNSAAASPLPGYRFDYSRSAVAAVERTSGHHKLGMAFLVRCLFSCGLISTDAHPLHPQHPHRCMQPLRPQLQAKILTVPSFPTQVSGSTTHAGSLCSAPLFTICGGHFPSKPGEPLWEAHGSNSMDDICDGGGKRPGDPNSFSFMCATPDRTQPADGRPRAGSLCPALVLAKWREPFFLQNRGAPVGCRNTLAAPCSLPSRWRK